MIFDLCTRSYEIKSTLPFQHWSMYSCLHTEDRMGKNCHCSTVTKLTFDFIKLYGGIKMSNFIGEHLIIKWKVYCLRTNIGEDQQI